MVDPRETTPLLCGQGTKSGLRMASPRPERVDRFNARFVAALRLAQTKVSAFC
jgi:hypothetical protein